MLSRFSCCCERDPLCTVYVPCCVRDVRVSAFVEAIAGVPTWLYTKRFTLTNECNDQESEDWSSIEETGERSQVDNSVIGGSTVRHTGLPDQGCTFGIDIPVDNLFCACGFKNFTARLTLCNPQQVVVETRVSLPSMSVLFGLSEEPCIFELKNGGQFEPYLSATLSPGEEHEFVMEFGVIDWKACNANCVKDRSDIIIEGEDYQDDQYDTTCLQPVDCAAGDLGLIGTSEGNRGIETCIDAVLCPPCGCTAENIKSKPAPAFVASAIASGTGGVTVAEPIGTQKDDILILAINGEGEDANEDDPPPGRWNLLGTVASGTDGNADRTRLSVYWQRFDPNDVPNYDVPDAGTYTHASITAWRGVRVIDTPIDLSATNSDPTNDTSVSVAGLTTSVNQCMVVAITTAGDDVTTSSWANASLTGVTQRVNEGTAVGSGGHIGIMSGVRVNAGTVTASTATVSASEQEANFSIALLPAESTWVSTTGCVCGCDAEEAMRACKTPKVELSGQGADSGEITVCEDQTAGLQAQGYIVIFLDSLCQKRGGIFRDGNDWRYERDGIFDPPGPVGPLRQNRTVQEAGTKDCTNYTVEWNNTGSQLEITVDGSLVVSAYTDWIAEGGGTPWALAQSGSTWSLIP